MTKRPDYRAWHERTWRGLVDLAAGEATVAQLKRAARPKAFADVPLPPTEWTWHVSEARLVYKDRSPFALLRQLCEAATNGKRGEIRTLALECRGLLDGVMPDIVPPAALPFRRDIDG